MNDCSPASGLPAGWKMLAIGALLGFHVPPLNAQVASLPVALAADKTAVTGQRVDENGFSPIDAGNIRIDGLYFDQAWPIGSHLLEA